MPSKWWLKRVHNDWEWVNPGTTVNLMPPTSNIIHLD